jgi:hypothetical protein
MATFTEVLKARQERLVETVEELANNKFSHIRALGYCIGFIESSINNFEPSKAIDGYKPNFPQNLPTEWIAVEGNKLISEKFEDLDDLSDAIQKFPQLKRVNGYIRSQLFIALMAELEDYLSQLLKLILLAYPDKLQSPNFDVAQILAKENALELIEDKVNEKIQAKIYKGLRKYFSFIKATLEEESILEKVLEERKIYDKNAREQEKTQLKLDLLLPEYAEMKARRDVGIHNNWVNNEQYKKKVLELGGIPDNSDFLGIGREYFIKSQETAISLVVKCFTLCELKFNQSTSN